MKLAHSESVGLMEYALKPGKVTTNQQLLKPFV